MAINTFGGSSLSIESILQRLQKQQDEANAANKKRLEETMSIYDQIISQFSEGGSFGRGVEAQLETGRKKAVAQGTQALVSSGLYNTEAQAGLGTKFEEEVAVPARLRLEDLRAEKLAQARTQKAAALERVEDTGPSLDMVASLMKSVGGTSSSRTIAPMSPSIFELDRLKTSTRTPTARRQTTQRVVDVPGHFSTGRGSDSSYSKGFYIPSTYKTVRS